MKENDLKKARLKIILYILPIIALVIICSYFFIWFFKNLKPIGKDGVVDVFVAKNTNYLKISELLQHKGVIRSKVAFRIYVLTTGKYRSLKAGQYSLSLSNSTPDVVDFLISGKVDNYRLTIPEGMTIKETSQYLSEKYSDFNFSKDDFTKSVDDFTDLPETIRTVFPQIKDNNLEGFLLGDTFYFNNNKTTADELAKKMIDNFGNKALSFFDGSLSESLQNKYQALILASLVEKEAKTEDDRKLVAGIFLNRLKEGSLLESCASVNYVLPQSKDILSEADLSVDSPYNTYLYKGLPPAPISNPSLESIDAVFHSTDSDYLYFLSDKDGNLHFAKTYEEHLQNRTQYIGD